MAAVRYVMAGGIALLVWLAVAGTATAVEVAVGSAASAVVVGLAEFDRRVARTRVSAPSNAWRPLVGVPVAAIRDTATLGREVVRLVRRRPSAGGFVRVSVADAQMGDIAVATIAATLTPNTVVIGWEPDRRSIVIHQLRLADDPAASLRERLP